MLEDYLSKTKDELATQKDKMNKLKLNNKKLENTLRNALANQK